MTWYKLTLGGKVYYAESAGLPGERSDEYLLTTLPRTFRLLHEQWSGGLVSSIETLDPRAVAESPSVAFQQPGMIYLAQDDGTLVICYGQGRLRDGIGARRATPVARVVADLPGFNEACRSIQFSGSTELVIEPGDRTTELPVPPEIEGTEFAIELADIRATARLIEPTVQTGMIESFLRSLPAKGFATNTHSSGPLVRFWNESGGTEGETPLDIGPTDGPTQAVLYYGYIYYMPKPGFRGLRIPGREATMMASAARGVGSELYPLAQFCSGLDEFSRVARGLRNGGSQQMRILKV